MSRLGEVEAQSEELQHLSVASESRPDPDTESLTWMVFIKGSGTWKLSSAQSTTGVYLWVFTPAPKITLCLPALHPTAEQYLRFSDFYLRPMWAALSQSFLLSFSPECLSVLHCSEASSPFKKGSIFLFAKGSVSHREHNSCGINRVQGWGYSVYKRKALRQWKQ